MPDPVKLKVITPGMYDIDVEPIPPRNRNNREVHLEYLKHFKESVRTLHEIVKEAMVEKPLDNSLAYACLYTKHSQELLEYVIGTCKTSTNNSQTHVEQQKSKKTNEPMIPSTVVKDATATSGSKPRSNTKKDMTLPAKSDKKKVEDHYRNNKSNVKQKNHVDSSISHNRTFVKKPPVNKWQPTGRKFTLGEQCPLTRFTQSKVVPVKQPENVCTSEIVLTERLSNTFQKPLTRVYYVEGLDTIFFLSENFTIQILKLRSVNTHVIHDEVLSHLLIVKSLKEQIMVVASSVKPLELRYHQ
ncbi:hypothetical protein Tco_0512015 [Tanacetum coccineum]